MDINFNIFDDSFQAIADIQGWQLVVTAILALIGVFFFLFSFTARHESVMFKFNGIASFIAAAVFLVCSAAYNPLIAFLLCFAVLTVLAILAGLCTIIVFLHDIKTGKAVPLPEDFDEYRAMINADKR